MSTPKTTAFGRKLSFLDVAVHSPPSWWPELLALWRPAGTPSGDLGLRLAIRNGYLNMYRKGQSVARVSRDLAGQMQWKLHRKYLDRSEHDPSDSGSVYQRAPAQVELLKWVKAAESKAGPEKKAIDQILDRDAHVIDLEMGLPAAGKGAAAFRIDMVSLEPVDDSTSRLRFWEVKKFDDARIRASGALPEEKGIRDQVRRYQDFLNQPERARQIQSAYQNCAKVLHALSISAGAEKQLGAEVRALAGGKKLVLAEQPGILVAIPERELPARTTSAWEEHRGKLERAGMKLRIERYNDQA